MSEKPPVVLIASQLLTAELWGPLIAALGGTYDFRVADNGSDDTMAAMATRLLADAPPRFDLIAHGMGGFCALEVMRRQPGRVRSLVLIGTLAPNDGPAQTERRMGYIRLVEDGNFPGVVEERVPILLHPDHRADPAMLAVVRRMALDTGAERFLKQQRAIMARIDSRPSLAAIPCPVLLIRGREDAITTAAHQEEMVDAIPDVRLETVEDCGHLVPLERPDEAARIIGAWLAAR